MAELISVLLLNHARFHAQGQGFLSERCHLLFDLEYKSIISGNSLSRNLHAQKLFAFTV